MKKSILLLGGLGIGAGILYAIGVGRETSLTQTSNGNRNQHQPTDVQAEQSEQNGPSLTLASSLEADEVVAKKSSMAPADNRTHPSEGEEVRELNDQDTDRPQGF